MSEDEWKVVQNNSPIQLASNSGDSSNLVQKEFICRVARVNANFFIDWSICEDVI